MENASDSPPDTPKKHTFLFWSAIVVIAILSILSIGVMTLPSVECFFINLTGTGDKLELLKFIGWIISGSIAIFGVIGLFQRAEALDKQNIINEKNHKQRADEIEKSQIQERFKAATEHLGSERVSVRIAAFYEFYRLAKIESEPDLKENIFDILCAHLRQTTKDKNYQKEEKYSDAQESTEHKHEIYNLYHAGITPTEEVQNLLNILFKIDNKNNLIFGGMNANLAEINLQGADLQKADLQKADLQYTNLIDANLTDAKLQNAVLQGTELKKAVLKNTELQGANMRWAGLKYARMTGAYLKGADMGGAKITEETEKSMPDNWKNVVKQYEDNKRPFQVTHIVPESKTGVLVVDDKYHEDDVRHEEIIRKCI